LEDRVGLGVYARHVEYDPSGPVGLPCDRRL